VGQSTLAASFGGESAIDYDPPGVFVGVDVLVGPGVGVYVGVAGVPGVVVTVDVLVGPGVNVYVGVAGVTPVGVIVEVTTGVVVEVIVNVGVTTLPEVLKIIGAIHRARSVAGGPEERIVRRNRISRPASDDRSISAL